MAVAEAVGSALAAGSDVAVPVGFAVADAVGSLSPAGAHPAKAIRASEAPVRASAARSRRPAANEDELEWVTR